LATQQLATQSQVAAARKALTDAQASLAAQRNLGAGMSRQTITAPYDAVVTSIAVQQGDRVSSGASVMQLMKPGGLQVLLGVEPEEASRVRTGMSIRLVPVFGNGGVVTAKVSKVFGLINPQTRLVDVAAQLSASTVKVLSGMQMRGTIDLGGQPSWVVSRSAVLRDDQGAYVFQVQDSHAKRIDVTTGIENNGLIAVSGRLDNKLKVVVLGNYELKVGMTVREAGT
jgi:RND family efflux transporter MFP subunit